MKKFIVLLAVTFSLFWQSCGSSKEIPLTPAEMKVITTRVLEGDYDLAFKSALSLLADQGYLVNSADKASGLITAEKTEDGKGDFMDTLVGVNRRSEVTKMSLLLNKADEDNTEIKWTIYLYHITEYVNNSNEYSQSKSGGMLKASPVYHWWFSRLTEEIGRNKK